MFEIDLQYYGDNPKQFQTYADLFQGFPVLDAPLGEVGNLIAKNLHIRGLILFHGRVYDFTKFLQGVKEQNKVIESMNLSSTRKTKIGLETLIMQFYRVESFD